MQLSIQGDASSGAATAATRDVAASIDDRDGRSVTATGQLVVFHVVEEELFSR